VADESRNYRNDDKRPEYVDVPHAEQQAPDQVPDDQVDDQSADPGTAESQVRSS
jgi:hypothetical protein